MIHFCKILVLFISVSASVFGMDVRVLGSDLLGENFKTLLLTFAGRNEIPMSFELSGSRGAIEAVKRGTADLALVSLAPGETPPGNPYICMPVAYHTVCFVVPSAYPITQLNYRQIAGVYGEREQLSPQRWMDLDMTGPYAVRSISANLAGPATGITYDLFRYSVLSSPVVKNTVHIQPTVKDALERISSEEGGIAAVPLPATSGSFRTLLIAKDANDVAYGPTPENLQTGDYPLRVPVYLFFRKDAAPRLMLVLRHLLSDDALGEWEKAEVIPLPIQARNQQIFDLEVL